MEHGREAARTTTTRTTGTNNGKHSSSSGSSSSNNTPTPTTTRGRRQQQHQQQQQQEQRRQRQQKRCRGGSIAVVSARDPSSKRLAWGSLWGLCRVPALGSAHGSVYWWMSRTSISWGSSAGGTPAGSRSGLLVHRSASAMARCTPTPTMPHHRLDHAALADRRRYRGASLALSAASSFMSCSASLHHLPYTSQPSTMSAAAPVAEISAYVRCFRATACCSAAPSLFDSRAPSAVAVLT